MRLRASLSLPAILAAATLAACSNSEEPRNAPVNDDLNTDTAAQTEGANSFTEDQARGHAENAGYENVSAMTLTDSGLWQGTGTRNGETMNVSVDYRGAVTTSPEGEAPPTAAASGDAAAAGAGTTAPATTNPAAPGEATMTQDPAAMPGATSPAMRQTGERG